MDFADSATRYPQRGWPIAADRALIRAFGLVLAAGILGASGAVFVIVLYGRLIPAGSLAQVVAAGGAALLLVVMQAWARARAGRLADEASQRLLARLDRDGEAARLVGQPLVKLLRSRSFMVAADLVWVPVFVVAVLALNPWMGVATGSALAAFARWGAASGPAAARPDAQIRARERHRRLALGSGRDAMQILLLSLGGALAIRGQMQIGEIVAATLLGLRALGAVSAALEDAPALRAALHAWHALREAGTG